MTRPGLLLVHLGTPEAPTPGAVRRYLAQFLGDRRVIDLPEPGRTLLLRGLILPFRPRRSARLYARIWTEAGSPLRVHAEALTQRLREALGPEIPVEHAMRYGSPSISEGLQRLVRQNAARVVILPMFPQAAASTSGTALAEAYRRASELWEVPVLEAVGPFYDHPGYVAAEVALATEAGVHAADHVLFSFHGLPERHVQRARPECLADASCCTRLAHGNQGCYRAQCFQSARAIATGLGLAADRYSVSFQSRLGREPWIGPFTEAMLGELRARGVRRLAVMCPAFTTDCLETLEEIGMRAREQFLALGGSELMLVPSLNADPRWVAGLQALLQPHLAR